MLCIKLIMMILNLRNEISLYCIERRYFQDFCLLLKYTKFINLRRYRLRDRLKRNKEKFKMSLKDINERYSLINCLLWSTVLSLALFVIDKKNLVTSRIGGLEDFLIAVIFIILIGIVLLSKLNLNKLMEYPFVNVIDKYLFIALGVTLIMQVIFFIGYENMFNYTWVNLLVISIVLVLIYNRINKIVLEKQVLESSVVDLQDILEGKVTTDKPFLVRESEVDYDLLSRDILISDLVNWIKNYQSNERFVVGIEGEWGSGKSTLIENVISTIKSEDTENEFIVIDDFEPWLSENKVALLENLLSRILRNPQLKISDEDVSKIIDNFTNLIFGRKFSIDFKFGEKDTEHSAKQIIADINKIIAGNNQKIIFIIDNLDRISSDNMLLLFNIIQNVLDFNNLIVIMSYDEHEVESVLQEKKISSGYLNKLVQKKVVLSPPNEDLLLNIYVQTIDSLATIFKSDTFRNYRIDEIQRFLQVLVSNNQLDMREFKRLLNSAIIPVLSSSSKYLLDQLVIEYIKFSNFTLYNQILVNADYFISVDRGTYSRFSYYRDDELDCLFNTFYEDLEEKYIKGDYELKLLALIFPNINIYSNGHKRNYKNAVSGFRSSPDYIEIQKNKRICSGKFFELYFTLNYNYNSAIIDSIDASMMGLKRKSIIIPKIVEGIIKYPANAQHDFIENFEYYIDELENNELTQFAIELLDQYFDFKSNRVFFGLDIDERIAIVVSKIFEKIDFKDYCDILDMYIEDPRYLAAMDRVKHWLDQSHTSDNTEKMDYIKSKQENYIDELLSTDASNLFDSAIYSQGNVRPVVKYISERDDFDHREYINQSLNSDTVFRIINDLIGVSSGSPNSYTYHIVSNPDEHADVKAVEDVLTNTEPKNEKEQFIKEVFQEYLTGEKDMFGTPKGIKTTESKDLRFV
ncbi:hypothetical protein CBF33_04625 [Vagococcus lutrae]|nr:hypothetical protein CBF33_04625 [Vagococcus lutrae]